MQLSLSMQPPSPSPRENEAMETASEEEEEEDPRSSDEEEGLSPVAMTTDPELIEKTSEDAPEIQAASKQESSPQQHGGKGVSTCVWMCVLERPH